MDEWYKSTKPQEHILMVKLSDSVQTRVLLCMRQEGAQAVPALFR